MYLSHLRTLVAMQLKDKIDVSFTDKNKRAFILKTVASVLRPVIVTAVFYLLFRLAVAFSVFSLSQLLPVTVISLVFTVVQLLAIVSCTVGLSQALFASLDNKVLLTLPVSDVEIFVSKLVLFYIFELKRNVSFTLPMFLAYGLVNGAVWYFYIWMIFCFLLISFLPMCVGAVLSIPAMFFTNYVQRKKTLQFALMAICAAIVVWAIVTPINNMPENINILGQWGEISADIQQFLQNFADALVPFWWLCCLVVGDAPLRISTSLFGWDTLAYLGGTFGVIAVFLVLAFLLARPLFFKMASKQFEYEKMVVPPKKNHARSQWAAPFSESFRMRFRSSKNIALMFVELSLPAVAVLFLNKLYAAMNTSYSGQKLAQTFNIVVMMVTVLSFNTPYASVYSSEAKARDIIKTRPTSALLTLFARIFPRVTVVALSCAAMLCTYSTVSGDAAANCAFLFVCVTATALAHLLWCAETDIMRSQAEQYMTIGSDYDNPNERTATLTSLVLTVLFALMFYLFTDRGVTSSFCKIAVASVALLAVRICLYITRARLYFVES